MRTPILIAAALLLAAAPGLSAGAQSAVPTRSLLFDPNALPGAPKAVQPPATRPAPEAKRQARTPPPRTAAPAPNVRAPTADRDIPRVAQPKIGRVPFETGTLGFTTDRKYSNSTFNDGRITPGFENVQTREPSYFGFSLSVPTDKQRLIPLPGFSRRD